VHVEHASRVLTRKPQERARASGNFDFETRFNSKSLRASCDGSRPGAARPRAERLIAETILHIVDNRTRTHPTRVQAPTAHPELRFDTLGRTRPLPASRWRRGNDLSDRVNFRPSLLPLVQSARDRSVRSQRASVVKHGHSECFEQRRVRSAGNWCPPCTLPLHRIPAHRGG